MTEKNKYDHLDDVEFIDYFLFHFQNRYMSADKARRIQIAEITNYALKGLQSFYQENWIKPQND